MRLHYHPLSTTSRPVLMVLAETGIAADLQVVDLLTGENFSPPFTALNPSQRVPVLEDDGFVLTECAAILKYFAEKTATPLYPTAPQARARVNERMDWLNTDLRRDLHFGLVYPQIFGTHRRPTEAAQAATLDWAQPRAARWLDILDRHILGPDSPWLCGPDMTIADLMGASYVALAEVTGTDFVSRPNILGWLDRLRARESWTPTFAAIDGYAATLKGTPLIAA